MIKDIHIESIDSEKDYDIAIKKIDEFMNSDLSKDEEKMFDRLVDLVVDYENIHFAIDKPEPIEMIKFRMDQMNLTVKDVSKIFGGESKATEILNGKRELTPKMIHSLHESLGLPKDVLIQ